MRRFRKVIFWLHLSAGLTNGVVIVIMCVTGALLSLERQTIEFFESDARYVSAPEGSHKLTPQQIIETLKTARPEAKPTAMLITNEPGAAWQINLGREGWLFLDPYTGDESGQ